MLSLGESSRVSVRMFPFVLYCIFLCIALCVLCKRFESFGLIAIYLKFSLFRIFLVCFNVNYLEVFIFFSLFFVLAFCLAFAHTIQHTLTHGLLSNTKSGYYFYLVYVTLDGMMHIIWVEKIKRKHRNSCIR